MLRYLTIICSLAVFLNAAVLVLNNSKTIVSDSCDSFFLLVPKMLIIQSFLCIFYIIIKEKECFKMKKLGTLLARWSKVIAPMALVVATLTSNATCVFFSHQPDVPPAMEKYRRRK